MDHLIRIPFSPPIPLVCQLRQMIRLFLAPHLIPNIGYLAVLGANVAIFSDSRV